VEHNVLAPAILHDDVLIFQHGVQKQLAGNPSVALNKHRAVCLMLKKLGGPERGSVDVIQPLVRRYFAVKIIHMFDVGIQCLKTVCFRLIQKDHATKTPEPLVEFSQIVVVAIPSRHVAALAGENCGGIFTPLEVDGLMVQPRERRQSHERTNSVTKPSTHCPIIKETFFCKHPATKEAKTQPEKERL